MAFVDLAERKGAICLLGQEGSSCATAALKSCIICHVTGIYNSGQAPTYSWDILCMNYGMLLNLRPCITRLGGRTVSLCIIYRVPTLRKDSVAPPLCVATHSFSFSYLPSKVSRADHEDTATHVTWIHLCACTPSTKCFSQEKLAGKLRGSHYVRRPLG